jgi:hypothetical protein
VSAGVAPIERAAPRSLPGGVSAIAAILFAGGLAAFLFGLANDPETAWRAFHVNYIYFGGLAQGGIVLSAAMVIIGARWAGPVQRIAESLGAWVPVTFVLGCVGMLGRHHVYDWIEHPIAIKAAWLNPTRMYVMDLAILGILAILTILWLKARWRPTLHNVEATGFAKGMAESWTKGWRGDSEEDAARAGRLKVLAPIICLVYGFGWSIIAFDQVMSLSPMWFSNLFGAFVAWGGFLGAVSVTTMLAVLHRNYPGLEDQITKARLHDLGKMIFAFSIFWMYLFFAQYLVIWYGNLPEETSFFQARLGSEFLQGTWHFEGWWERIQEPYVRLTLFTWICVWVIPFWFLLGQRPKRTYWFVGSVAFVSAFGLWLERNVLIWPSLVPDNTLAPFGWIQIGVALGFLGAFALVFLAFSRVFPSLAVPRDA